MRPSSALTPTLFLLAYTAQGKPVGKFAARCEAFAKNLHVESYNDIKVTIAEHMPANSFVDHVAEGLNETCRWDDTTNVPVSVCRLQLQVPTSKKSGVVMEVWLPEDWSGRSLTTGNGGFGGCVEYGSIAYGTSHGFATFGTNNGHEGMSGGAFFNQPEVLQDFVWRSIYTSTIVGKSIIRQFYGKKHKKSYYFGCSTGGRQGWKAVQSYPDLFDGVVVAAPAMAHNSMIAYGGLVLRTIADNSSASYLKAEDWNSLHEKVMAQCDGLDGAVDGILEDASACKPDFTAWVCNDDTSTNWCLSPEQVSGLQELYSPYLLDGNVLSGGFVPGYERSLAVPELIAQFSAWVTEWMRYVVKSDLSYDPDTFSVEDARELIKLNPFNIQTFDADISAFRDRGGKVLHLHGQADDVLTITTSDRYYDKVSDALGASSDELDDFYRYFRISGMAHCTGGPGAYAVGQTQKLSISKRPEDNILSRIVEWVEKNKAPEFVRGAKFVNDDPSQGVAFTRKHCKHPKVNHYFGKGNGTDEKGWRCVKK